LKHPTSRFPTDDQSVRLAFVGLKRYENPLSSKTAERVGIPQRAFSVPRALYAFPTYPIGSADAIIIYGGFAVFQIARFVRSSEVRHAFGRTGRPDRRHYGEHKHPSGPDRERSDDRQNVGHDFDRHVHAATGVVTGNRTYINSSNDRLFSFFRERETKTRIYRTCRRKIRRRLYVLKSPMFKRFIPYRLRYVSVANKYVLTLVFR